MNNKLKLLLLSLNVSVALTACIGNGSDGSKTEQKVSDKNLLQNINNPLVLAAQKQAVSLRNGVEVTPQLGFGFDNRTGLANAVNCLANAESENTISTANPKATINLTKSLSNTEMSLLLNQSISGSFTYGLFSGSANASFVYNNTDTRNRLSYSYAQTLTLDATYKIPGIGKEKALSKDAQELLSMGNDVFTSVCGDSYVSNSQVGAVLMISANIEFASAANKIAYSASASGGKSGLGEITAAFNAEFNSSTKNATLNLNVIQLGGDASKLAEIFGQKGPNGYYMVSCSAGNLANCDNAINAIIDYAKGDFQKSIDIMNPANFKNYYTFNTNRTTYKQLGVFASLPDLTPEAEKAKNYLVKQIQADRDMLGYLIRYQKQSLFEYIDPRTKDDIFKATKDYNSIIKMYTDYDVLYSCYGSGAEVSTKCVKAADTIKEMRSQYKESITVGHNLSVTYLIQGPVTFKLVSASDWNVSEDNYGSGVFIPYDLTSQQFILTLCVVDGSPNNTDPDPKIKGKYFYCLGDIGGYTLYGSRINKNLISVKSDTVTSIMGYKSVEREIDFPLNPQGFNTFMIYSNDKDFKYNPI